MIEVKNVSKYFSKPLREPGFKGPLKLFLRIKKL